MGITTALNLQWVVCSPTKTIMNKFLAVFCLAATVCGAPDAEADPALLYNTYGYGLGAYNYGAYGLGAYGYAGYPYTAYHHAPLATGYAQVSPSASLSTAGLANAAIPAIAGGYAGAGRYVANSAGVVHVAKREAEAEADAEADPALFYSHYGYGLPAYTGYSGLAYNGLAGYPYSYGAYPYSYGLGYSHYAAPAVAAAAVAPAAVAAPVATGYAQVSPSASLTTVGLADASIPAVVGGYAGAGRYVANSAGVVHVA